MIRTPNPRAAIAAALTATLLGAAPTQAQPPATYDPAIETQTTIADGFTFVAVGDIIYPLPFADFPDPAFQNALKPITAADVAYGNLEMSAVKMDEHEGPSEGFMGVPAMVDDLKAMGFDAMGRANNHLYDYGQRGMLETNAYLEKVGIAYAGSGKNYGAAHAPRYLMTPKGRVAFVATATSHSPYFTSMPTVVRATLPNGEAPGRPGVAQIATVQKYVVPRALVPSLQAVKKAFPTGGTLYAPTGDTAEEFSVMNQVFKPADVDRPQFTYTTSKADVDQVLRSIREGKIKSDFLAYGLHTHETQFPDKPDTDPMPGDFLQGFARQTIDAGADVFVGTGVHVLRGIEIYKGKPIYYGLGEFFRQMDMNRPGGQMPIRGDINSDPAKYETVVAVNRYQGGRIAEIRLYPIDMGATLRIAHRGVPRTAPPEQAQRILKRLQTLSAPYGTVIDIRDNIGVITVQRTPGSGRP